MASNEFMAPETNNKSKPRILVVDDTEANRYHFSRILHHAGFEVIEATTGRDALEIVRAKDIDLVILDVGLPDMLGYDVCRAIKEQRGKGFIPVLQMSAAFRTPSDAVRGLDYADNYLVTPVEPGVLVATVRALLRVRLAEERALREARQWNKTFDSLPESIFVVSKEGKVLKCNASAEKLLAASELEIVGQCYQDVIETAGLGSDIAFVPMPGRERRESREQHSRGEWYQTTYDPILDERGNQTGAIYIWANVTETRALNEKAELLKAQFEQSQKLESLGILAGGIAHDFNNLLVGIMGSLDLIREEIAGNEGAIASLSDIHAASRTAANLCQQMLTYSGHARFAMEPVNLNKLIAEVGRLMGAVISKKAQLEFDYAEDLGTILGDRTQLSQVMMNLITNASESLEDKHGTIRIKTGTMCCDRRMLSNAMFDDELAEGEYNFLEISDTGYGMTEDTLRRMFDPFFTTKFTGRGLGLAAVLGIVRSHHGFIDVNTKHGEGTTVRLAFPLHSAEILADTNTPPPLPDTWRGEGTVLLVDDMETVRIVGKRILEKRGFTVLTAENGEEAVRIFEHQKDEIICVVLDIAMPVMDGFEAYKELKKIDPGVCVILSSGYSEKEAYMMFDHQTMTAFVPKPYEANQLLQKVRDTIQRCRQADKSPTPED